MKIAVDFREGAKPNRAGKGEYIFQLVATWAASSSDEVVLLVERGQQVGLKLPSAWRVMVVPANGLWWQFFVIAWLEFLRPVQVYFSATSLIVPTFVRSVRVVTTIADFTVWRFPSHHLPRAVWIERICMPWALRFSNHLLAISEFTKQEAIDLFRINPAKMTVIPLAVGAEFTSHALDLAQASAIRQKYNLPEHFFLYLGTLEPRKNIQRLVTSFVQLASEFPQLKLVLAGARGWLVDELIANHPQQIIITGYIEAADRPALYKLARAFVFPSLYEGFGLPPLEAMSSGVPVLTSRVASLPEVVGDAAILVDPKSDAELVAALRRLADSPGLRDELRQKGLVQAQKFNWAKTTQLTLATLRHG